LVPLTQSGFCSFLTSRFKNLACAKFNSLGGKSPSDKGMRAINYIFFLPAVPFQMQGVATPKAPVCGPMTY